MMSRSRSQGTEVTIVTGAFSEKTSDVFTFYMARGREKATLNSI